MPVTGRSRELIQKYLEMIASGAELAELQDLLAADPEIADAFVEAVRLDASLSDFFRRQYKMEQIASLLKNPHAAPSPAGDSLATSGAGKGAPAATPLPSDSVFVRRDIKPVSARHAEFPPLSPARSSHWKKWIALAVLVLLGIVTWSVTGSRTERFRLISGRIAVAGKEVAEITANVQFEVVGPDAAVIEASSGPRIELATATRAALRRVANQVVVQVISGGGNFRVEANQSPLRVETSLGSVTAKAARFSMDFATAPSERFIPSIPQRFPRLSIVIAEGSATIERASVLTTLSAGEQRVFFSQT